MCEALFASLTLIANNNNQQNIKQQREREEIFNRDIKKGRSQGTMKTMKTPARFSFLAVMLFSFIFSFSSPPLFYSSKTLRAVGVMNKVEAFKAQDFKTCETSSFCNRHRDAAPKAYSIGKLNGSVSSRKGEEGDDNIKDEATFDVLLDGAKTSVEMKLIAYANGAVRLRFDDILHPRYVPKDVLLPEALSVAGSMLFSIS